MTWHDEREPAVYAAGERQRELDPDAHMGGPAEEAAGLRYLAEREAAHSHGLITSQACDAFALLEAMGEYEREQVMRCFCLGCFDRLKAGDVCHCRNDE